MFKRGWKGDRPAGDASPPGTRLLRDEDLRKLVPTTDTAECPTDGSLLVVGRKETKHYTDYKSAVQPSSLDLHIGDMFEPPEDPKKANEAPEYTTELINVLNVLGWLVNLEQSQANLLERVCSSQMISADELHKAGALTVNANSTWGSTTADRPEQSSLLE